MANVLLAFGCGEPPADSPGRDGERGAATLVLLHTSDLHSRVWPFRERISSFEAGLGLGEAGALEELGGFARLASVLQRQRQEGAGPWLDSGDALEGAEVFERFGGQLELELLGALGLAAMALGNHELSLSASDLARLLDLAPFPVLAAGLRAAPSSPLAGRLAEGALLEAQGLTLGVVGVANPSSPPNLASVSNPWGLSVAVDLPAAVQEAIDQLRPRAELIVVLSHLGLERDRELLQATSGVDLLLGGHQHVVTREPEWQSDCALGAVRARRRCPMRAVPMVHSGAYGKLVSRIELSLTRSQQIGRAWEVAGVGLTQLPLSSRVPQQPDVLQRLEQLQPPRQPPLGFVPEPLHRRSALGGDSALGNLTADALRTVSGAEVVVLNSSGLRGDVEAGLLLEADLSLVLPFAEPWLATWVSGKSLKRGLHRAAKRGAARDCESLLQVSGLKLAVRCSACARGDADCLAVLRPSLLGSRPLADDEIVELLLPRYLTLPGADFEHAGGGGRELEVSAHTALAGYLAQLPSAADVRACTASLAGLPAARCQQVFGAPACPIGAERALGWCRSLPGVVGRRDDRIRMLP